MAGPMALHWEPCHIHPGSTSGSPCRLCRELSALRMYRCARCGETVLICNYCDCGQIYCAQGCAQQARRESLRKAGASYQGTFSGRRNHAARQKKHRLKKQKVTHQGPPPSGSFLDLLPAAKASPPAQEEPDVANRSVSLLPVVSPPSLEESACPAAPTAPSRAGPASPPAHVCHFCRCTQSQYLRRDTLCHLRRQKRHRGAVRAAKQQTG